MIIVVLITVNVLEVNLIIQPGLQFHKGTKLIVTNFLESLIFLING